MPRRRKYRRKANQFVIATRLDLAIERFEYRKWGARQRAKRGDWLVDNAGDVYTVDGKVFARTYKRLRPGIFVKTTPVWAEVASKAGVIKTKEGESRYRKGDYIVYNDRAGTDAYCMSASRFRATYKPA
ncbi:MAG: hypothetical protein KJ025_06020 [Burkholderiales bacterium]|nr:hypothetical protein [Burkholderiales bacterium]